MSDFDFLRIDKSSGKSLLRPANTQGYASSSGVTRIFEQGGGKGGGKAKSWGSPAARGGSSFNFVCEESYPFETSYV